MKTPFLLLAAVLAMVLAVPSVAEAQSDDGSSVEVAILDVLLARGLIDQAEYDELLAMARAKVEADANDIDLIEGRLSRLTAPDVQVEGGKPGKLLFKSPDGKWSAEFKGRIQARVTDQNQDDGEDGTNFSVPRARFGIAGNAGGEHIKYKFEIDAGTSTSMDTDLDGTEPSEQKDARIKDAYIDYGVTESGSIRFGQYKFPFGREQLISSGAILLMERSIASVEYSPAREPGMMLHGKAGEGAFEWQVATSNGDGENEPNTSSSSADGTDDGLRWGGRVVWNPMGEMKYDGPAFQTVEDGSSRMAVGLAYMINNDAQSLNTTGAPGDQSSTIGAEFQYMTGPFSILAEYFDRTTDLDAGGDLDDDGYSLQGGVFLEPKVWELVARLSGVDEEDAASTKRQETALGVNRYIDAHNGKWMVDFVDLENDTTGNDEQQLRLQYQVIF